MKDALARKWISGIVVGSGFMPTIGGTMTGQLLSAVGTAGAPGIAGAGDADTGMNWPAANTLAWSTGGSERMRIDSSGNVGIGTSSPIAKLHTHAADGTINFAMSGTTKALRMMTDAAYASIQGVDPTLATSFQPLQIGGLYLSFGSGSNIAEKMRLDADGKLGIGTSSPSEKVHISGGNVLLDDGYALAWRGGGATDTYIGGGSVGDYIALTTAGSEGMRLDASGNVAIGGVIQYSERLLVNKEANSFTYQLIRNPDAGSGAFAGLTLNAYGNSWAMRIGSMAANSNALEWTIDALGAPIKRLSLSGGGDLTPGADNTQDFGSNALRWAKVRATRADLGGTANAPNGVANLHHAAGSYESTSPFLTFNYSNADPHFAAYMDGYWNTVFRTYAAGSGSTPDIAFLPLGVVRPGTDNSIDLGKSSHRWAVVYAGTGNFSGVQIGTSSPTAPLDVAGDVIRLRTAKTPASATVAGNTGDHCWDADYFYVCTATNTWKRTALATW